MRTRAQAGRLQLPAVMTVGLILISACAGAPTATDEVGIGDSDDGGDSTAPGDEDDSADRLEELYAELEGLDREERRERLIEIAREEEPLDLYASTNPDDAEALASRFNELTGLEISHYRANASAIRNRLLQESSAGFAGADAVVMDGTEMALIDDEGMLLPLQSPYLEDFPDQAVFDNWAAGSSNVYIAVWNTDRLSLQDAPKTWEDVLAFDGEWGIEIGDYDWFATLVKEYFMDELGLSEEEAVDRFREGAQNATPIDGHTLLVEMLTAGEFDVVSSAYHHRVRTVVEEGAPISWDAPAPVEPVVVRPSGIGIARGPSPGPRGTT
ncbi:MAG: extracellular solute-binding protein, partial [Chloroflexi bacterium]|nr:extracellular solute-binding protein [Chloroflexota bacterium]